MSNVAPFETLSAAFEASTVNAEKQGLEVVAPIVYGGIQYGEYRSFTWETVNLKRPNSKKRWQVSITRFDNGFYELVDYYL